MNRLEDKKVLITGGNSGLGKAMASRFVAEGASVLITGRNVETLAATQAELGAQCHTVEADVLKLSDLDKVIATASEKLGRLDVVIANAGGAVVTPGPAVTEEYFDMEVGRNFKGVFFTVQKAMPLVNVGGSIVLVASIANSKGFHGMSIYGAAKAAVRSLSRTLAAELAPQNIRINTLSPGTFLTPGFDRLGLPEEQLEAAKAGFAQMIPLGRTGQVEELANAALFLASDESTFMTGSEMVVDGGAAQV